MPLTEKRENGRLTFAISGCFDALIASALDQKLLHEIKDIYEIVFDFKNVTYMASAGLRIIMIANKAMTSKKGSLKILHVRPVVREIFELTAMADLLTPDA